MKWEIKKFLEKNDNEKMMTQSQWEAAKAILRGKFIVIQPYLKKQTNKKTSNRQPNTKTTG